MLRVCLLKYVSYIQTCHHPVNIVSLLRFRNVGMKNQWTAGGVGWAGSVSFLIIL